MIQKAPAQSGLINHNSILAKLTPYPREVLLYSIEHSGDQIIIGDLEGRNHIDDIALSVNGNLYEGIGGVTLDLSNTGINSGRIDGLSFTAANARDFLIWGMGNNPNTQFQGYGLTHKPYSAFTGPASATKGASVTFTGVTSGFQFTEGSRVAVQNTVGTSPLYEWNWGTVQTVANTTCQVLMDNNTNYGVNLTAATGGQIRQWNKFRPWVVSATEQTLFSPHYNLLGEGYTNASGNYWSSYKKTDPWRALDGDVNVIYTSTAVQAGITFPIARFVPLWANSINLLSIYEDTATNKFSRVQTNNGIRGAQISSDAANIKLRDSHIVHLSNYTNLFVESNSATKVQFDLVAYGYEVAGGMRP